MTIILIPGSNPTYTVDQIRADVRARGWDTDTDEEQLSMINTILREIYGEREWGFLEATVSYTLARGDSDVFALGAAPNDFRFQGATHLHIQDPQDSSYRWELEKIGADDWRDEYDRNGITPDSWTRPDLWAHVDDTVQVTPIPDLAYVVDLTYQRVLPDLTEGTDVIPLPSPYQDIITAGVLAELALRERDFQSADRWAQVYSRRHNQLVRHDPNRYRRDGQIVKRTGVHDAYNLE